jgi:hypothetical protein
MPAPRRLVAGKASLIKAVSIRHRSWPTSRVVHDDRHRKLGRGSCVKPLLRVSGGEVKGMNLLGMNVGHRDYL